MPQPSFEIGGRRVGAGAPVFVVAEVSANHGGRIETARAIIEAAAKAGADAVKLQTYTPDTLTIDCGKECFRLGAGSPWAGRTLYELYEEAHTPWEWHAELKELAESLGLILFSTPFDDTAVDFLENLGTPIHKIASFELNDLPLLRKVASTGKPVIASTGTASLDEIDEAVATLRQGGAGPIGLLKCTSAYPARPEEMNLCLIPFLSERYGLPVGLSDHSLGSTVAIAAVALGASIIEKHLTLSRSDGGPDAAFSMEPDEFSGMVGAIRDAERSVGAISFDSGAGEQGNRQLRRSLFVVADMRAGEVFSMVNVRIIRPGYGLAPKYIEQILGRRATRDIQRGTPLAWELVEGGEGRGG